jgi:uncharacterized protein (TIGR02058 family)
VARKRFVLEFGMGIDLHGEDPTKAACRAVKDAIGRSCLCGLLEIHQIEDLSLPEVDIQVACPLPDKVDLEQVKQVIPIGQKTAKAVPGGMSAQGLCVPQFGPECSQVLIANAAVTVWLNK